MKQAYQRLHGRCWGPIRDDIQLAHPSPLASLKYVRSKIYGKPLDESEFDAIIQTLSKGRTPILM